jgi:hypothetical protein
MDEPLNTDELAVTHRELQTQFAALATLLKGVRDGIKSD